MRSWQPATNILHLWSVHAIAATTPSIGAYLLSAGVQNRLPVNTRRHPSEQQVGAWSLAQEQYFWRSKKSMPFLLQSGARQVVRSMSKVEIPSFTRSMICALDFWNASSRFWSHTNLELGLTRSLKGCITDPSEKAQATWFTNPNHDLASVMFWGVGKSCIAESIDWEGATREGVNCNPANCTVSWQNWNFFRFWTTPFFWHIVSNSQTCDRKLLICHCHTAEHHPHTWLPGPHLWSPHHTCGCKCHLMPSSLVACAGTWSDPIL